ncbi:MAG: hypothetical protein ACE5D1_02940 [Fidelibacterota bacterium]
MALGLLIACSLDPGLTPVSGVEGVLSISDAWPDSIEAVVLAVLSEPSAENLSEVLVSYSDPLNQGETLQDYFIQLPPGAYILAPVGVTVDPGFLIANLDSILAAPHLPLVPLFDVSVFPAQGIQSVAIVKDKVTAVDTLTIQFP